MAGIAETYLQGVLARRLGPDWKQKQEMGEIEIETARKKPGLIDLQTEQARGAIQNQELQRRKAQQELDDLMAEREELKRTGAPSTNMRVNDYLLRQKKNEVDILNDQAQRAATEALTAERKLQGERVKRETANLPSPEESRRERELREKYLGAQTGAAEALGEARGQGREFAGAPVPRDVWEDLKTEVEGEIPEAYDPWFGAPDPAEVQERGRKVEEEVVRRAKARGYMSRGRAGAGTDFTGGGVPAASAGPEVGPSGGPKIVRDAQGQQYIELPNGVRIPLQGGPVRPESAGAPEF